MHYFRYLITSLAVLLLASCKISITVPEGGTVVSASGKYNCNADNPCEIEVQDFTFDETFIAKPDDDYDFVAWSTRQDGICSGTAKPCRMSSIGLEAFEAVAELLNSEKTYFLVPNFVKKSDKLRLFTEGDAIHYRGSIAIEDSAGAKSSANITATQNYLNSESSIDDNDVMLQELTLRLNSDGSEFPESSFYWQDDDGTWIDASDTSGNFLVNAQTNKFGVINYRSPLAIAEEEEVVLTNLVNGQEISEVVASGTLTTQTIKKRNKLTGPMGTHRAFKVVSRVELEIPDSAALASIVVDQVHWVVPYIGPVIKKSTQRSYDSEGNLIETLTSKMEATKINF